MHSRCDQAHVEFHSLPCVRPLSPSIILLLWRVCTERKHDSQIQRRYIFDPQENRRIQW